MALRSNKWKSFIPMDITYPWDSTIREKIPIQKTAAGQYIITSYKYVKLILTTPTCSDWE